MTGDRKPAGGKLPLVMSGLVYPGVGQFMQRRVLWGLVYGIAFTIFFIVLCVVTVQQICAVINQPEHLRDAIRAIGRPFALLGLIWLANLYDVWWADRRHARGSAEPPPL